MFSLSILAACFTASTIFTYPVHLHMFPLKAFLISASVGSGFTSSNALELMTIPGMQNPHCTAPAFVNAYAYASISFSDIPSMVTIFLPTNFCVLNTQAFVALPSIITIQVPHAPSAHPFFTEVMFISSLKNSNSFLFSFA